MVTRERRKTMKEYCLHIWGGAMPHIKEELGIEENYYYFQSEDERNDFLNKLKPYEKYGLARDLKEGEMTHKRTIASMDLVYKDNRYHIDYDFGYEYPKDSAEFMFFEGNYSCDCNKSIFINDIYESFELLDCVDEVEIENFIVSYLD
jgi:hypothetical protein